MALLWNKLLGLIVPPPSSRFAVRHLPLHVGGGKRNEVEQVGVLKPINPIICS